VSVNGGRDRLRSSGHELDPSAPYPRLDRRFGYAFLLSDAATRVAKRDGNEHAPLAIVTTVAASYKFGTSLQPNIFVRRGGRQNVGVSRKYPGPDTLFSRAI
jgi:hypothetical protein